MSGVHTQTSLDSLIFSQLSSHDIPSLAELQDCRLQRENTQNMFRKQCIIAKGNKDINELETMQLNDLEFTFEDVMEMLSKKRNKLQMKVSNITAGVTPDLMEKRAKSIYDRVTMIMEALPKNKNHLVSEYNNEKLFIMNYYAQIRNLRTHMQLHDEDEVVIVIIYYYLLLYNMLYIFLIG